MFLIGKPAKRLLALSLSSCLALTSVWSSVAIACEGATEETGSVGFVPSSLDFGTVGVGKSGFMPAKLVANSGEVTIKELRPTTTWFTLSKNECNGKTLKFIGGTKECSLEVKFIPISVGSFAGEIEANEAKSFQVATLSLKGTGKNEALISPAKLEWEHNKTGGMKFKLTTLTTIKLKKFSLTDTTNFKIIQLTGCKETESFGPSKACEVEIKRETTTLASATFKWEYEEGGKSFEGQEGLIGGN